MNFSKIFNVKAFLLHFIFSFIVIGGLAFLIVNLWYPGVLATELGGYKLVVMILILDLCVGPLCVGLSYKPHKSKKANTFDIVVITMCQLAFFSWGAWTVSVSRPVFIVFDADRFELVVDQDILPDSLSDKAPFNHVPRFSAIKMGIVDIVQTVPDENERIEVSNDSIFGKDLSKMPKYYVPYEGDQLKKVLNMAKDYKDFAKTDVTAELAKEFMTKHRIAEAQFKWLAIRYFSPQAQGQQFMTAVIDDQTGKIIDYIVFDPYEI